MTHLFMEVPKTSVNEEAESVKVTRTGQAAVLINIAICAMFYCGQWSR